MLYVGEFKERLNITMGYSLKKTQVFSLINFWWDLQKQSVQGELFHDRAADGFTLEEALEELNA
jgi:hypothetical protein